MKTGAVYIICHPELAKDLTAGQPALGHHSAFSKLTAPPDEPSGPNGGNLRELSGEYGSHEQAEQRRTRIPGSARALADAILGTRARLSSQRHPWRGRQGTSEYECKANRFAVTICCPPFPLVNRCRLTPFS